MTKILDPEALDERARNLAARNRNGFSRAFVTLDAASPPAFAWLDVEFQNDTHLAGPPALALFGVSGGTRIKGGSGAGQVKVISVAAGADSRSLRLKVAPVGDYSTYTLSIRSADFDTVFSDLDFKFRPGCFNLNCRPDWQRSPPPAAEPVIDYLAKDYDSFRHVLMAAMAERVPGWQPTSEADLDQVLIDLIAADADELSDFQDRAANEAWIATARKRVSLARHARLMDYHIHQGNQASTWLAVKVASDLTLPKDFGVWTGEDWKKPGAVLFAGVRAQKCYALLNELQLYTWDDTVSALEAGSSEADLTTIAPMDKTAADALRNALLSADVERLAIQEVANPETGTANGRDIRARQIVRLLPLGNVPPRAESVEDTVTGHWMVRVRWRAEDRLQRRYCFLTHCPGIPPVTGGVSRFYGNLAEVSHGRPHATVFRPTGSVLAAPDFSQFAGSDETWWEPTPWGALCRLPQAPLAWRDTPPGGETPPRSTLEVVVGGIATPWAEQSDLIESEGDDDHFIVETDEEGVSLLRFGNGVNGRALPHLAAATCRYRVGQGVAGNVGADTLTGFDPVAPSGVDAVWNPLDVVNGREPEPRQEILRRVPEAYRQRQLRAVTLDDYARRAEELPEVAHAKARYAWTGSWRTVRVAIDPRGTTVLDPLTRKKIERHLDAVRLIGEDLEIRPASYVALDIHLDVCAHPQYWPEDLRAALEMEFSDGYTPDGRLGFFHPDLWTFGQTLHASQIVGRALAVQGVERMLAVRMRRWAPGTGGALTTIVVGPAGALPPVAEKVAVTAFEIIQVANDPSRLETGRIVFDIAGGRR